MKLKKKKKIEQDQRGQEAEEAAAAGRAGGSRLRASCTQKEKEKRQACGRPSERRPQ